MSTFPELLARGIWPADPRPYLKITSEQRHHEIARVVGRYPVSPLSLWKLSDPNVPRLFWDDTLSFDKAIRVFKQSTRPPSKQAFQAMQRLTQINFDNFNTTPAWAICLAIFEDLNQAFFGGILSENVCLQFNSRRCAKSGVYAMTVPAGGYARRISITFDNAHPEIHRSARSKFKCIVGDLLHEMTHAYTIMACSFPAVYKQDTTGGHGPYFWAILRLVHRSFDASPLAAWGMKRLHDDFACEFRLSLAREFSHRACTCTQGDTYGAGPGDFPAGGPPPWHV